MEKHEVCLPKTAQDWNPCLKLGSILGGHLPFNFFQASVEEKTKFINKFKDHTEFSLKFQSCTKSSWDWVWDWGVGLKNEFDWLKRTDGRTVEGRTVG